MVEGTQGAVGTEAMAAVGTGVGTAVMAVAGTVATGVLRFTSELILTMGTRLTTATRHIITTRLR